MNLAPRAANQLHALEPGDAAAILDHLDELTVPDRASLVQVETPGGTCRCFVARHRDGSLVLLVLSLVSQVPT